MDNGWIRLLGALVAATTLLRVVDDAGAGRLRWDV